MNYLTLPLVFLIILGVWFRFQGLSNVPGGLYVDEASIGENAYQISKQGVDEWGEPYPVYFRAFGEYKNPLLIYTAALLFVVMPPDIHTLRLAVVVWGLLGVVTTTWAVYEISSKKTVAFISAVFLLFMPWHFHASRVVFEVITMPAIMALVLAAWAKALKTHRLPWYILTAAAIGLLFYSYTAARLFAPLFLLVFALQTGLFLSWKHALLAVVIGGLCFMPALYFEIDHPGSLTARFNAVALHNPSVKANIFQMMKTYGNQFSPRLWLISGDGNLRHSPGRGLLPLSWTPFFIAGLMSLLKTWRKPIAQILLFLLASAPAAAALTQTDPNALRMIHIIPLLVIMTCLGLQKTMNRLKKWTTSIVVFAVFFSLVEGMVFINGYFKSFSDLAAPWFETGFVNDYPALRQLTGAVVVHGVASQVTSTFLSRSYPKASLARVIHVGSTGDYIPTAVNLYPLDECRRMEKRLEKKSRFVGSSCIIDPLF